MKACCILIVLAVFIVTSSGVLSAKEITMFSFENGPQGWAIPDWAQSKEDYVGQEVRISEHYATKGERSFEVKVSFPHMAD